MRSTSLLMSVISSVALECERKVELVILQDASASFAGLISRMPALTKHLLESMNMRLETQVRASMASFIDKAIPGRGLGGGRGHRGRIDYCYNNTKSPVLSEDFTTLSNVYEALTRNLGNGGDNPENQHEALLYGALDPKFGWTPSNASNSHQLVKILLMVTDDFGHVEGAAWNNGIELWNKNEVSSPSGFQFWDGRFAEAADFYEDSNRENYAELLDLKEKLSLTDLETKRFADLYDMLGPDTYAAHNKHPYNFDAHINCEYYEYPDPKRVGEILKREDIIPIIALSDAQKFRKDSYAYCKIFNSESSNYSEIEVSDEIFKECLINGWTNLMKIYGVKDYLVFWFQPTADQLVDKIIDTVEKISRKKTCESTNMSTSGVEWTQKFTMSSRISGGNMSTKPISTTHQAEEKLSTHNLSSRKELTYSSTNSSPYITATTSSSTEKTREVTATAESTIVENVTATAESDYVTEGSEKVEIPPVNTSVNVGAVVGATGGATIVAGLAVASLYKYFWSIPAGHTQLFRVGLEQVDVPDLLVERESIEEVSMEMFH